MVNTIGIVGLTWRLGTWLWCLTAWVGILVLLIVCCVTWARFLYFSAVESLSIK